MTELKDVLITGELSRRTAPVPDLKAENQALHLLAREMTGEPQAALDALASTALRLCRAGSAGVSLLEPAENGKVAFRTVAIAGACASHAGRRIPVESAPSAHCLQSGSPQLYHRPHRIWPDYMDAQPEPVEVLVVPLRVEGRDIGTIWVMSHDDSSRFTQEDVRILTSLGGFTAAALAMVRARQVLEERETQLARDAMLLANVRDSVIVTDLEGTITFWNQGATRLFGWESHEMIGRPLIERLPPELRPLTAEWIARIRQGEEFSGEWCDYRKDGSRVWIYAHTAPLRDASGRPVAIMGVSHDISGQKESQAEMTRARDSAEAANRAKDQFLAVLSHELRTPLSPVVMAVASMESDPDLPERLREDVSMVRRNVELESRLIDDLLDLSRVASGKLRLDMQPTHINQVLRHVIQSSTPEAASKDLSLHADLAAEQDLVRGDASRLQQVFWNLVRNAIKFTPPSGRIHVRSSNQGPDRVRVEVRDTGIGIAPELLPAVFNAFNQGDTRTTRQFGGLGLGLAIAKAIIEMHGGTIAAHSDGTSAGATFTIELATAKPATEEASASPDSDAIPPASQERFHVLLVEDHADTARILAKLLNRSGFVVKTAGSVASALDLAASQAFDVIVSDIGLPDASGYDLMREVRRRFGINGIALTGYGMDDDVRRSRDAGFAEHIVKPVNIAELRTVIARVAKVRE